MPIDPTGISVDTEDDDLMKDLTGTAAEELEYFKSLYKQKKKKIPEISKIVEIDLLNLHQLLS